MTNILSPAGTVVKGYDYDEFGQSSKKGDDNFLNEMTFTGSVMDATSGLQYMNARYYQPSTGRFLSQDTYSGNPYDPWTQHLYSYTGNNPTSFIDPTGHFVISFLVGLAVGALVGAGTELVADIADDGEVNRPAEDYLGAAASGAIGGVAAAATGGSSLIVTTSTMALGGAVGSAVDQAISEGTIDYGQVALDAATSGAMGGIFHGVRGNINRRYSTGRPLYDTSGDISSPSEVNVKKPEIYTEPARLTQQGKTPLIGKMKQLNRPWNKTNKRQFRVADYLPDTGDPKSNWHQNSGILRSVMRQNMPIKDVTSPKTNTGFLRAERNLLQERGWIYSKGYWLPPIK